MKLKWVCAFKREGEILRKPSQIVGKFLIDVFFPCLMQGQITSRKNNFSAALSQIPTEEIEAISEIGIHLVLSGN